MNLKELKQAEQQHKDRIQALNDLLSAEAGLDNLKISSTGNVSTGNVSTNNMDNVSAIGCTSNEKADTVNNIDQKSFEQYKGLFQYYAVQNCCTQRNWYDCGMISAVNSKFLVCFA